jgi:hypothetical protein
MADETLRYKILLRDEFTGTLTHVTSVSDKELGKLQNQLTEVGEKGTSSFRSMAGAVSQFLPALSAAGAGYLIKKIATDSMAAAAQVEGYMVTLKTLLGSSFDALSRMEEYQQIAAKTPFELSEVVEAGNKLQTLGRYSKDTLVMLGDLAAASGKPFEQVMSAYSKLVTGQKGQAVEQFRDLLITADDWVKATGKGVTKNGEMLATTKEMEAVIGRIMREKNFTGMMAAQAETTKGKISNLNDSLFQLQSAMGEKMQPTQKQFIKDLTGIVGKLTEWVAVPIEDKMDAEVMRIRVLKDELLDVNTSEQRRLTIFDELKKISPEITEGINREAISYETLTSNIDKTVAKIKEKIFWQNSDKKHQKVMDEYSDAQLTNTTTEQQIREMMLLYGIPEEADFNKRIGKLRNKLARNASGTYSIGPDGNIPYLTDTRNSEYKDYDKLDELTKEFDNSNALLVGLKMKLNAINYVNARLGNDMYGSTTPLGPDAPAGWFGNSTGGNAVGLGTGSGTGMSPEQVLSGSGSSVKQIIINLDSLIKENINQINNALNPESDLEAFKDKLTAALLSVLNDVNLMIPN